jgi:uncharacterized protein YkwD
MRAALPLALTIFALALLGCEVHPVAGDLPSGPEVPPGNSLEASLAGLVAEHRAGLGCGPLSWVEPVAAAAGTHARDMATAGWWGHQGPQGESMEAYLKAHGVSPTLAGDALARNFTGKDAAARVFRAWLDSPSHRAILEDCRFRAHGAGYADGHWTWYGVR